jgi:deazaflavin-dependent oxidoreductase (nitroreductase family)
VARSQHEDWRVLAAGRSYYRAMSSDIKGIRRVDPSKRAAWKPALSWWMGGRLLSGRPGQAVWRRMVAPNEAPLMRATRGRVRVSFTTPIVVLTSTGAHTGKRRDTPLTYFTDGDDVILIASNYGGERHPGWYHNLLAHPECELHIGPRGGRFVARQADPEDRDRLFALATRVVRNYAKYAQTTDGIRTIPVMRLTPAEGCRPVGSRVVRRLS